MFVGDYDYKALCTPRLPCLKQDAQKMHFFGVNDKLPLLVAAVMGLQHAFAMVGGLITPPYVVAKFAVDGFPFADLDMQQYAISSALICSGIFTIMNVVQVPIPLTETLLGRKIVVGTGVLSVMGTSFTFLPIFEIAIAQMKADGVDGKDAYGKMLGTVVICSFLEIFLSFVSAKRLRAWFPPIITGITVLLIGAALTGTGMKYWGGGVVCAEMGWKMHSQVSSLVGFGDSMVSPIPSPICEAGEVSLAYGAAEYIGLGASVIIMLVVIEIFGSPFMKNANVILALLFGYFVAGVSTYEADDGTKLDYVTEAKIDAAPWFTFLWVESYSLGFYGPAVLPLLVAFMVTTVETIGDIGATFEASELEVDTEEHGQSVQGGLLADGISSLLAAFMTSMPNTTFSQNNGVVSMTKCASRHAGIACGVWLIIFGLFGKVAGIITAIPDCVLGGMTIFLFANVFTSGLKIISAVNIESRRNRFIIAMSMALGLGVTVWPYAFQDMRASSYTAQFWTCDDCSNGEKGLRNALSIFMSTGYCVGTVIALLLNGILPADSEVLRSGAAGGSETEMAPKGEKI
jgi:uracil-xanthine permease